MGRNGKTEGETGRNGLKWEETGRNGKKRKETVRNGKKRVETGRNGKKGKETGRNGKRKTTTNSIDDNKITQPLWRGRTRRQENRQARIVISTPSPQFLGFGKNQLINILPLYFLVLLDYCSLVTHLTYRRWLGILGRSSIACCPLGEGWSRCRWWGSRRGWPPPQAAGSAGSPPSWSGSKGLQGGSHLLLGHRHKF